MAAIFLQPWVPFALIAGAGLFGYNLFAKFGGGNLPPVVFAFVMYLSGFVATLPLFTWFMKDKTAGYLTALPGWPLLFAIGAGTIVILIDICVAHMFNKAAPVGIAFTIVFMVSLSLTTMVGIFLMKEPYSIMNLAGIVLALFAIPMMLYKAE